MNATHFQIAAAGFKTITNTYGDAMKAGGGPAEGNIFTIIGTLITVLVSVLGVILLGFMVVAGFYWITAGGNSSQIEKAKKLLMNTIIGLVLLLASVSLARFIETILITPLTGTDATPTTTTTPVDDGSCPGGVC